MSTKRSGTVPPTPASPCLPTRSSSRSPTTAGSRQDYIPSDTQLDGDEKRWIRARTSQLGDVIVNARNATGDPRLVAVDIEKLGRFADNGNGICAEPDSERYVNGVTPSDRGESFHPTVPGYVRLAQDLLARIGSVV